ncbi:MAG: flagellar M-ring protein FliF [Novosphingobium sp.]|nr:flagellar M-ring protein FliF [Novosphingobium sp.]
MAESDDPMVPQGTSSALSRQQFWLIAALVSAVLLAVYWLLLRSVYVPVLVGLDPLDSADVAKVLDEKKIGYRFEDQGRTIAVSENEADRARVELAGSELPMKGQIGFELFNQSDLGLTEFAQKINYQRALQGELARTILLFDGIQTVRVHLGLPERSMFRGEQVAPRASVTLVLKPGKALSAASVEGIQRLVAGAIPDLGVQGVAVLDGTGKVVSPAAISAPDTPANSDAVIENARKRVNEAVSRAHPDLRFGLNLSLNYRPQPAPAPQATGPAPGDPPKSDPLPRGVPDYVYSLRVTTEQPLDESRQADIRRVAGEALKLDAARGDTLVFLVGPIPPDGSAQAAPVTDEAVVARAAPPPAPPQSFIWQWWWLAVSLALAGAVGAGLWLWHRRRQQQRRGELSEFAQVLRERLENEAGAAV